MSVLSDVRAVQCRIAQLAGLPPAAQSRVARGDFGSRVRGALGELAVRSAKQAAVDPALVVAVIATESGFDPGAISRSGARGLMQLMPATAAALGVADPDDPAQNVRGGATYLRQLLERFHGDLRLALAAYNAGPGAVERYRGVPPFDETRAYVARVLATYRALAAP